LGQHNAAKCQKQTSEVIHLEGIIALLQVYIRMLSPQLPCKY
jgi:hypothetical protein